EGPAGWQRILAVCGWAGLRHKTWVHWCPAPTMLSLPEGKQEQAANAMNRIDYKDAPAIAEAVIGPKVAAKVRNMTKKMETVPPQKISVLVGSRKTWLGRTDRPLTLWIFLPSPLWSSDPGVAATSRGRRNGIRLNCVTATSFWGRRIASLASGALPQRHPTSGPGASPMPFQRWP